MDRSEVLQKSRASGRDEGQGWIYKVGVYASMDTVRWVCSLMLAFNVIWILLGTSIVPLSATLSLATIVFASTAARDLARSRSGGERRELLYGLVAGSVAAACGVGYVLAVIFEL